MGFLTQLLPQAQQWISRFQRSLRLGLLAILVSSLVIGCSLGSSNSGPEITLVSFAVTRSAYNEIIPAFVKKWQQEHNQTITISQSYGGSGAQARSVADGLEADVVHLALALDINRIEQVGLIEPGWDNEFPNQSIVSKSVVALVTREGNPKGIQAWDDLGKEGLRLITADPKTSGVARWNFLALWNAAMQSSNDETKAQAFVTQVYRNAPILSRDAREATDAFYKQGQGDVLINYENEILLAAQKGQTLPFFIPDINISIDNPIAIVDKNVARHKNREVAEAFVQYLFTPEAQAAFAKAGFRPIDPTIAQSPDLKRQYPPIKRLSTVADYGGWKRVQKQFFADNALFDQIQAGTAK